MRAMEGNSCQKPSRLPRDERGASAIEFALVVMILVTFLAGITQFGVIFFHWLEIIHGAREGARWASLSGHPDGTVSQPGTTRYQVWQAAPGLSPRLTDGEIDITPSNPTIEDAGDPVRVTVTYTTPIFTPVMQEALGASGPSLTLVSSATQRIE